MDISPISGSERQPTIQRSTSEMIRFRDERRTLVFTLVNGTTLEGVVRWFDDSSIGIADADRDEMTLFKHAILYFKAKP
jgi:RNA chaperone Hfq